MRNAGAEIAAARDALLATEDPDITYFVQRDLMGQPVQPITVVQDGAAARRLWSKQRADGSWRGPKKKNPVYPETHSDLLETFKQTRLLVERYEADVADDQMRRAAEYLLSYQTAAGDIRGFLANQYATYYTGYVLSLLIRAGYGDDDRIVSGLEWLLTMRQDDGGWTIPILTHDFDRATGFRLTSEKMDPVEPDRSRPFSHNWTDMVLRAFAAHSGYREHPAAGRAAELLAGEFFKADAYGSYQDPRYWTRFGFWWPNLLTAMESLHLLGFDANHPAMARGVGWFCEHRGADGLWHITNDGSPERDTPVVRERRAWLTLRICRLLRSLS